LGAVLVLFLNSNALNVGASSKWGAHWVSQSSAVVLVAKGNLKMI